MIILLAAIMAVQSPPAAAPPTGQTVEVRGLKKKKPARSCQLVSVSGSRMKQRICTDEVGVSNQVGVTDGASNPGMLHAQPGASATSGGLGAPPQ